MKAIGRVSVLAASLLMGGSALAQQTAPPYAPPQQQGQPPPPPPPPGNGAQGQAPAPPPPRPNGQAVYSYQTGQWVFTDEQGWVWVPAGASTQTIDNVPYTYLYTPAAGWTWYISPWGPGRYRYGGWVHHAWRPVGWRGGVRVAPPRVVVRIGPHYR